MRVLATQIDCPAPPPEEHSTSSRALHRACLILGGVAQLALHLGQPEPSVRAWVEGREPPPQMVFLAAVEIILLHLDGAARA